MANETCKKQRTVFYLSDRTGITVETLGHSLLTQFDGIQWNKINIPFLDNPTRAQQVAAQINAAAIKNGCRPIVFSTLVKPEVREIIGQANCVIYDFFERFIDSMEQELMVLLNNLGIGAMGMGGTNTVLGVHIEKNPCHIASLPVSVNVQCHSTRHMHITL